MSGAEDQVRKSIDVLFDASLERVLPDVVTHQTIEICSDRAFRATWPKLLITDIARLDSSDPAFLVSVVRPADFVHLLDHVSEALFNDIQPQLEAQFPGNKYARGAKLRTRIADRVQYHRGRVEQRAAEYLNKTRSPGPFPPPSQVRSQVIERIATACVTEATAVGRVGSLSRHFKVLAFLATCDAVGQRRTEILGRLTDGSSRAYPLVPRYVSSREIPRVTKFVAPVDSDLELVANELAPMFPEMELVHRAHKRFRKHDDFLSQFMPHNRPPHPSLRAEFEAALVRRIQDPDNPGVIITGQEFLERERRQRQGAPEGVAVATSLTIALEWVMQQVLFVESAAAPPKARGASLFSRLSSLAPLTQRTQELLAAVFPERALGVRDRYSHGLYFGDSRRSLESDVAGLSETITSLRADLVLSGTWGRVTGAKQRWDASRRLDPAHDIVILQQRTGADILQQPQTEPLRKHLFFLLELLLPDKRLIAQAAFLFWVNGRRSTSAGARDEGRFLALLNLLASLEAFVRAVVEHLGGDTLLIEPQGPDLIKTSLAMLADDAGQLLSRPSIDLVFPGSRRVPELAASIAAIRAVRDLAFHGHWAAWSSSWDDVAHLMVKLMLSAAQAVPLQPGEDADRAFLVNAAGPELVEKAPPRSEPSHEEIAVAAYFVALARGMKPGHELDDWLAAERYLRAR